MEKQTKISYWFLFGGIGGSVVHNFVYGLFKIEEPIFFFISIFSFIAFLVSLIFNLITYKLKGRPKDLWCLSWIGLFGLLGFLKSFGPRFFGLYAFFAFFGFKKR